MINLVINSNIRWLERGGKTAHFIQQQYPNDYCISTYLKKDVDKNVILTQQPIDDYKGYLKESINGIHFIRPLHTVLSNNLATNGYAVYKANKDKYRFMIPLLSEIFQIHNITERCLGFYYQQYKQSIDLYLDYLDTLQPSKIMYMGIIEKELLSTKHTWIYTESKEVFFNTVTHFIYAKSKSFVDPWPTTLEEAVAHNKQIIIINTNRSFQDGIDDILCCIDYHNHNDHNIYNTIFFHGNSLLNTFNHKLFYDSLLEVNWDVRKLYDSTKFRSIKDFLLLFQR